MHPAPPLITENGAPSQLATAPASSSAKLRAANEEDHVYADHPPRNRSGVSSCRTMLRMTMLIVSAAPVSASAAKVIQNDREKPKITVASP
jgi:hypothetical protein